MSVKTRNIHKNEKRILSVLVFLDTKKGKYPICLSKKSCEEKHFDLLLIGEESERHYVLIKDFNTFMYDYTLYRVRKYFCRYCLQALTTSEILKCHIKDCFKINRKQRIKMPKKCEYVRVKNY